MTTICRRSFSVRSTHSEVSRLASLVFVMGRTPIAPNNFLGI
jgi:hypothetical protein